MSSMQDRRERKHLRAAYRVAADAAEYFKAKLAHETTPAEVKARLDRDDIVVLDVRDREAFAAEHIPGARSVPLAELSRHLGALPRKQTIAAYCGGRDCSLAARACVELAQKGFTVQELAGGLEAWTRQGLPVERT